MTMVKTYLLVLSLVAMAAAALVQGLTGAPLTPVLFVMVATLAAAATVAWTRKPLSGLIVAAWLSLGPIFMPYAADNLRDGRTGVVAGMTAQLIANGLALLSGIAAYRDYRRRQLLPAPTTEQGHR
jgi:MFS family permease